MMESMQLEFALELRVTVGTMEELGPTGKGIRRIIPITGGHFTGPLIKETLLYRVAMIGRLAARME